jgi:hypothetical protein
LVSVIIGIVVSFRWRRAGGGFVGAFVFILSLVILWTLIDPILQKINNSATLNAKPWGAISDSTNLYYPTESTPSNNLRSITPFDLGAALIEAFTLETPNNNDSALVKLLVIDSVIKEDNPVYSCPHKDSGNTYRLFVEAHLSKIYFNKRNYDKSLSYAKAFDSLLLGTHIVCEDTDIEFYKNDIFYNKIWSNVALGNLKDAITASGDTGRLGFHDEKVSNGFRITKINENSPAEHNHLKIGDIFISFNNILLKDVSQDSLGRLIRIIPRGSSVNVGIIRDSVIQNGFITMGIIDSIYESSITE